MADLAIERTISASPARVWKALTNKEDLEQWLPFFADFEPVVGHEIRFELGRDPEHQYKHVCKVYEVVEGKKLVYGWRYDGYAGDSQIVFELFPDGDNTRVVLTHKILKPFPADNPDFSSGNFKEGWTYTIDGLKKYVEKVKE